VELRLGVKEYQRPTKKGGGMQYRQKRLLAEMALALGVSALAQPVSAETVAFSWSGKFSIVDPNGGIIANTSIGSKMNQYLTPVSGTLMLDSHTGSGTVTVAPFLFFSNPNPVVFSGFALQTIGDGFGGSGSLLLGNALADWGGNYGIPVSFVFDASGLLSRLDSLQIGDNIAGVGVRPAVDGNYIHYTYPGTNGGYLDTGPVPIATTKWNTTPLCPPGGGNSGACMNVNPSGGLPLIEDTTFNQYDYNTSFMGGDGSNDPGFGGSPLLAGPFESYSPNIDFTTLTVTAVVVPVPAAAWLLGAGLVGLIGVGRRRKSRS
jgi:hypothetical protein